jgi:hypothetical protein
VDNISIASFDKFVIDINMKGIIMLASSLKPQASSLKP